MRCWGAVLGVGGRPFEGRGFRDGTSKTSPSLGERLWEVPGVRPPRSSPTGATVGHAATVVAKPRAPRDGVAAVYAAPTLPLGVGATLPRRVGADCPGTALGTTQTWVRERGVCGRDGVGQGETGCCSPESLQASFPSPLPGLGLKGGLLAKTRV